MLDASLKGAAARRKNLTHLLQISERESLYRAALAFLDWLEPVPQKLPKSLSVIDQLDRASPSIPLNIAEGNGKFTAADRCRFFDIARGSALESAAALDVLVAKKRCAQEEVAAGKDCLWSIVSMRVGLIRSNSDYRLHEGNLEWGLRLR